MASRYGDTDSLAQELVRRGWLTALQMDHISKGRVRELFLGPYVLLERLGQGGMGHVFKARHQLMNRLVALKVIRQERQESADAVRRFQREIRAAASLSHPNIVAAYDADHADDRLYFVMEYVEGIDLAKFLKEKGRLPIAQACDFARQAALGLQHAHEHGLVHRDIKPGNLLLSTNGTVKLLDMGLARYQGFEQDSAAADPLTTYGAVMGTADYMAPEQAEDSRATDIRSDIYSLGCTLYHLLTGKPPFAGGNLLEKLHKHQTLEPAPVDAVRPELPRELGKIVRRMMAKRPAERLQNPAEVADALAPFAQATSAEPLPPSAPLDPAAVLLDKGEVGLGMALTASACGVETNSRDEAEVWRPICNRPEPAAAPVPHTPTPPATPAPSCRRRWLTLTAAGVLLAAGFITFVLTVVRINTPTGTLIIESEDQDVAIVVKRGGHEVQIIDLKEKRTIDLPVGEYEAALTRGKKGLRLKAQTFEIVRGQDTLVKVRWEPAAVPAAIRAKPPAEKKAPAAPPPVAIRPDLTDLATGDPMSPLALVSRPAKIKGLRSWTLETLRHRGAVHAVAYRKDGRLLASGGEDGVVRLWDPVTRRQVRALLGHDKRIVDVAWSPDGRILATGSPDRTVRLWDIDSGQVQVLRLLVGVYSLAWSPNSERIAAGGFDGPVYVWDVRAPAAPRVFQNPACALAWSPDGKTLACGGWGGPGLILLDVNSGQLRRGPAPGEQPGRVFALAYSPDGKLLASGNDTDDAVRLFDAQSGELRKTLHPKIGTIRSLAWVPDGATLAATSGGSTTVLLDVASGKSPAIRQPEVHPRLEGGGHEVCRIALSPDGKVLVVGGGNGLAYWHVATHLRLDNPPPTPSYPTVARWSKDGKTLAVGTSGGWIGLWDTDTPQPPTHIQAHASHVRTLAWSPEGQTLASAGPEPAIGFWSIRTSQMLKSQAVGPVFRLSWSPRKQLLAWTGHSGGVTIWDTALGRVERKLDPAAGFIAAWSPDGERLAAADAKSVHLWDRRSGQLLRSFKAHDRRLAALAWAPDGKTIATGGHDGSVRLWAADSGQPVCSFAAKEGVFGVAWSPDGQIIIAACSDGALHGWEVKSRKMLFAHSYCRSVLSPYDWRRDVVMSPDSKIVATDSDEGLHLWDAKSGRPRGVLLTFDQFQDVAIGPEGHFRGSPKVEQHLVYVAQTDRGQETLTPEEFVKKYGWKNDPARVKLIGPTTDGDTGKPKIDPVDVTPDRRAAEWVLSIGGGVRIRQDGQERGVGAAKDLPPACYELVVVFLGYNQKVDDAGLEHLEGLTKLTAIELHNTRVSDAGLEHLKTLSNLSRLWLMRKRLSDAGLVHMKGFINLTELDLFGTQVSGAGLEHLKGLTRLRNLGLGSTRVSNAGLVHLKEMPQLTSLSLSGTEVSDAGLVNLEPLTKLTALLLSGTRVSDAGLEHLKELTNLEHLNLDGTHVGDAGLEHLKEMTKLMHLNLDGTHVGDAGLQHLKEMTKLLHLALGKTRVGDAGLMHLRGLGELGHLNLNDTRVSDAGLVRLKGLTNLTYLHLRGTRVSDTGLKHLAGLSNLKELDVTGTRVTADGVAALKKALPKCTITWVSRDRHAAAWGPPKKQPTQPGSPVVIHPDRLDLEPGDPLSPLALVNRPTRVKGVRSWTIETRFGHRGRVWAVKHSPDDRWLASGGQDGTVRIWDAVEGRLLKILVGHSGAVTSLAWSPDCLSLASGSMDGTLRLWNARTGLLLRTLQAGPVHQIAWSPKSNRLAACCAADNGLGFVKLWDGETGGFLKTFTGNYTAIAWSPDGRILAIGNDSSQVALWDNVDDREVTSLVHGAGRIWSLAWSSDGKLLASASLAHIHLWDIARRKLRTGINKLPGGAHLAWSADGKNLAVRPASGMYVPIEILDIDTGKAIKRQPNEPGRADWPAIFTSVSWSPKNGLAIGCLDGSVRLWDPEGPTARSLRGRTALPWAPAWCPKEKILALGAEGGWIHLWNRATGDVKDVWEGGRPSVYSLAWSPDGTMLASGTKDHVIRLWNREGQPKSTLNNQTVWTWRVPPLSWSPDSKVLSAGIGGKMHLWSVASGKPLPPLELPGNVTACAWSPDGRFLASAHDDGNVVHIWDCAGRKPVLKDRGQVSRLSWSPDSKKLALAEWSGVRFWETDSRGSPRIFEDGPAATDAAWSPTGRLLAVAYRQGRTELGVALIRCWDLEAKKPQARKPLPLLLGHSFAVSTMSWRADGKYLASASIDETVRLWDPHSGCVGTLLIIEQKLVRISPEGHYCGGPTAERNLVYVVQTDRGQETLDAREFAKKYGWKNEPRRAILLDK